jgi:hypothetical protein
MPSQSGHRAHDGQTAAQARQFAALPLDAADELERLTGTRPARLTS